MTDQFLAYLLHDQSFHATLVRCARICNNDKIARIVAKQRLTMILDRPWWSTTYRPSIMRIARGDSSLAVRLRLHDDVFAVCDRNLRMVRRAAKKCVHRIDVISPMHADALGEMTCDRVRPHAGKFVQRRARFLTLGESGKKLEDMRHDLEIIGLRCFRWYYAFRTGVHMDNTVRTTITNRGLSYVKYETRQCRARMVTDEHGNTVNMESHDELALERHGSVQCEQRASALRMDIERMCRHDDPVVSSVAQFIGNPVEHDSFVDWIEQHCERAIGSSDVCEAVRRTGHSYGWLLDKYLRLPRNGEGERALTIIRDLVA